MDGRVRHLAHRHAVPVGDHPRGLQGDPLLLPAHRHRGERQHRLRQADGHRWFEDPGDVLERQRGLRLRPEDLRPVLAGGPDGHPEVQRRGGHLAADQLRRGRHVPDHRLIRATRTRGSRSPAPAGQRDPFGVLSSSDPA
ncbi:hypothetical protein SGPA1_21261 [Streptomyces misionensis JCM 4497]